MQLIALVYKDQHVNKLERLLNDWLETSLSESSEDNESNTSPQDQVGTLTWNYNKVKIKHLSKITIRLLL